MCIARLSGWLELDALQAAAGVTVCLRGCYKPRKQHQDHVDDGAYMPAIWRNVVGPLQEEDAEQRR